MSILVDALSGDNNQKLQCYISNSSSYDALIGNDKLTQVPDIDPQNEFGIGDLPLDVRLLIRAYDEGKSFMVTSPLQLQNATIIATMIGQSICRNEKVVHITGRKESIKAVQNALKVHNIESTQLNLSSYYNNQFNSDIVIDQIVDFAVNNSLAKTTQQVIELDPTISSKLSACHDQIVQFYDLLNVTHSPWQISVNDIIDGVSQYSDLPNFNTVLSHDTCANMTGKVALYAQNLIELLKINDSIKTSTGVVFGDNSANILDQIELNYTDDIEMIVKRTARTLDVTLPAFKQYLQEICQLTELVLPNTVAQWLELAELLSGVRRTLDVFTSNIYELNLQDYITATAERNSPNYKKMSFFERNSLIKEAEALVRPGFAVDNLHTALVQADEQKQVWMGLIVKQSDSTSQTYDAKQVFSNAQVRISLPSSVLRTLSLADTLVADLQVIESIFKRTKSPQPLLDIEFSELEKTLNQLISYRSILPKLPERTNCQQMLANLGLAEFSNEYISRNLSSSLSEQMLEKVWYSSVLIHIGEAVPLLSDLSSHQITQLVEQYCELDQQHIATLALPVKYNAQVKQTRALEHLNTGVTKSEFINQYFSAFSATIDNIDMLLTYIDTNTTVILEYADYLNNDSIMPILEKSKRVILLNDSLKRNKLQVAFEQLMPTFPLQTQSNLRSPYLSDYIIKNSTIATNISNVNAQVKNIITLTDEVGVLHKIIQNFTGIINISGAKSSVVRFKKSLKYRMRNDIQFLADFRKFERGSNNAIYLFNLQDGPLTQADYAILLLDKETQKLHAEHFAHFFESVGDKLTIVMEKPVATIGDKMQRIAQAKPTFEDFQKLFINSDKPMKSFATSTQVEFLAGQLSRNGYHCLINYSLSGSPSDVVDLLVLDKASSKVAAVLIDTLSHNRIVSLRYTFRQRLQWAKRAGYIPVQIMSVALLENSAAQVAKIKEAFLDDKLKQPAKYRMSSSVPTSKAREQEILHEKPPHWG